MLSSYYVTIVQISPVQYVSSKFVVESHKFNVKGKQFSMRGWVKEPSKQAIIIPYCWLQ